MRRRELEVAKVDRVSVTVVGSEVLRRDWKAKEDEGRVAEGGEGTRRRV